jgi:DNA-binding transcriptional MerR regulator
MPQKMVFRIGEFARLAGVNKKTLQYYDAQNIFKPDSIAQNGYRCYSSRQLYSFYMIRILRDMGLSLAEIREYLEARSPERFAALLRNQQSWLQQEIHRYERMKQIVQRQLQLLQMANGLDCEHVFEQELPEGSLVITQNVRFLDDAGQERVIQQHVSYCLEHGLNAGNAFGTMVAPKDFQAGHEDRISYYFTQTDRSLRYVEKELRHLRPAGRYAVTYFRGDYMETSEAYERLRAYFAIRGLQPAGYSYEESIIEDMSVPTPEDYITRIAIPI